jgi:N-acetylglucosaminyl-diphospho-decaprenol L-rhamnosyltransferase
VTRVAVVVVTYSPGESLATFISTLSTAATERVPVILADNGSEDGVPLDASVKYEHVSLVATGGNVGYGAAANAGVAATDAELVLIANPDIVWSPGALDLLVAATDRWPGAGSFGPLIRNTEGEIYPSARAVPSLGRGIGHALCGWWWPGNPWTAAYRNERRAPRESVVGWLSGACLLVRRAAFDAVGGFDPGYFMYFEDLDLGERLARAAWQNVYVPAAEVTHVGAHATARDPERMATEHHRSAWRWVCHHYRGLRWAPVRFVLRIGLAARAVLARWMPTVAAGAPPHRRPP